MADIRVSFPMLEDASTEAGLPLHKVLEGDAILNKNALAALAAKDASDNFKYLKVNANGELIVNTEGNDLVCMSEQGTITGHKTVYQDVVDIALTAETVYKELSWVCSCFRDAHYEILWIEDEGGTPTEHLLADVLVGSGDLTDSGQLCVNFTTGATGDQILRARAINQNALSDFRASLSIHEVQ